MTSATAPGKIILFGEHAVVYGRPAIAVPVRQVQAMAEVSDLPGSGPGVVRLEAPDIGFSAWLRDTPHNHPLARVVRLTLQELRLTHLPAFHLRVTSSIPIAAGLGSGTAVSVAAIRAISQHFGTPLPPERVSALSFEIEKIHHGTPSGIDNTVIAYEQPVYYVRGQPLGAFDIPVSFPLLIIDSGRPSPTSVAVSRVRERWQREFERCESLFDAIGMTAENAIVAIESGRIEDLGPLMNHNQAMLESLGISTPILDRLIAVAREAGALGAKISGAGMGGSIIALAEPAYTEPVIRAARDAGAPRVLVTEIGP
jgi:mevalonate kinase